MVYDTLDDRCSACVVQGGIEPACVNEMFLEAHRSEGHDCPRREWTDPYDPIAARVAFLGARQETGHLFHVMFDALGLERDERLIVMNRLLHAYQDEAIAARLWPKPE